MSRRVIEDQKEIETILQEEKIGHLGTFSDPYPYVIPLYFVYHHNSIYFHSGLRGEKLDSINKNPRVCFQVDRVEGFHYDPSPCKFNIFYKSVIIFGTAVEVTSKEEKMDALNALSAKFAEGKTLSAIDPSQLKMVKVIKIEVEKITAKANEQ
ncbi:MAG: pyridoxamine 5'-phosphate oxidase family protein [Dethiobacter sp.]|jgi:nitroimidazol reductase NimA-like FMN-containing flavoprotein (pyridoxamine 5'-phosphate oxidase superfamily)|nr:MAG: pyridoxamine 5'-phosphate oxidase family protein [Dethiobacter sp.]